MRPFERVAAGPSLGRDNLRKERQLLPSFFFRDMALDDFRLAFIRSRSDSRGGSFRTESGGVVGRAAGLWMGEGGGVFSGVVKGEEKGVSRSV